MSVDDTLFQRDYSRDKQQAIIQIFSLLPKNIPSRNVTARVLF